MKAPNWTIEYCRNHRPMGEILWQWWNVTDGKMVVKCDGESEAKYLCGLLNQQQIKTMDTNEIRDMSKNMQEGKIDDLSRALFPGNPPALPEHLAKAISEAINRAYDSGRTEGYRSGFDEGRTRGLEDASEIVRLKFADR